MRNPWPWRAFTSVAIAAAGTAWAQAPGGAGSPTAEGTHEPTPKMQGSDTEQQPDSAGSPSGSANGAPVVPDSRAGKPDNGTNSGPSPRDEPSPSLRPDDGTKRLPSKRDGNGANGRQDNGNGADNGTDNGASPQAPEDKVRPQNPANPATPIFPANPQPQADPGQPGNPVTPTHMRLT